MGYSALSKYRAELMGLAMLWVMLFHASGVEYPGRLLNTIGRLGFGGVDIFILLSAAGLVRSLSSRKWDYSSFMARRGARILPAYYAVMLPYTLFLILSRGDPWAALLWNSTLLYYWLRNAGAFNWYVAGIMTFYAVTPACFRRLKSSGHRERLTAAGVMVSLAVCRLLAREGYWYVIDFFFRVPVFFLGLLIGFYSLEDRPLGRRGLLFWCGSLLLGGLYALWYLRVDQEVFPLPLCHLFLFTTMPMCLTACLCFEKLPLGWLRRFLRLVGVHSLEIYLLNVSFFSPVFLEWLGIAPRSVLSCLPLFGLNILLGVLLHRLIEVLHACRAGRGRPPGGEEGPINHKAAAGG